MIFNVTVIIVLIVHYGNNNDNIANINKFIEKENIDNYGYKDQCHHYYINHHAFNNNKYEY